MGKKLLCFGLIFPLMLCFTACGKQPNDELKETPPQYEQPNDDSNDNFTDDEVIVILTAEVSFEQILHDYTPEDFPELNAIFVKEFTEGTTHKIRQYLSEDPSGAMIPDHLQNFRRSFIITLTEKSKENVLQAVENLYQRDDVYAAEPNYLYPLT